MGDNIDPANPFTDGVSFLDSPHPPEQFRQSFMEEPGTWLWGSTGGAGDRLVVTSVKKVLAYVGDPSLVEVVGATLYKAFDTVLLNHTVKKLRCLKRKREYKAIVQARGFANPVFDQIPVRNLVWSRQQETQGTPVIAIAAPIPFQDSDTEQRPWAMSSFGLHRVPPFADNPPGSVSPVSEVASLGSVIEISDDGTPGSSTEDGSDRDGRSPIFSSSESDSDGDSSCSRVSRVYSRAGDADSPILMGSSSDEEVCYKSEELEADYDDPFYWKDSDRGLSD